MKPEQREALERAVMLADAPGPDGHGQRLERLNRAVRAVLDAEPVSCSEAHDGCNPPVATITMDPRPGADPPSLPCPHGRPFWQMCPHCNGINAAVLTDDDIVVQEVVPAVTEVKPPERCLCDPQIHAQVGCPAPDCPFNNDHIRLAVEVARSLSNVIHLTDCHNLPASVMSEAHENIRLAFRGGRGERPSAAEAIRLATIEEAAAVLDGYANDMFEVERRGNMPGCHHPSELYREAARHVRELRHKRKT